MKHIKKLIDFINESTIYDIKKKSWDHEIGYIWSPKARENLNLAARPWTEDISVNQLPFEHQTHSTYGLFAYGLKDFIHIYLNIDTNKDLCIFHPTNYNRNKEFDFNKYCIDQKKYIIINYKGVYTSYEVDEFDKNYRDTIRRLLNRNFTDRELEDIGSWHIDGKFFDVNGIKFISFLLGGDESFIMAKNKVDDLVSLTDSYQYYRYVDKDNQITRFDDTLINFSDLKDIFLDFTDSGFIISDCYLSLNITDKKSVAVEFTTNGADITKESTSDLRHCISHFENRYGLKLLNMSVFRIREFDNSVQERRYFKNVDELEGTNLNSRMRFCISFA